MSAQPQPRPDPAERLALAFRERRTRLPGAGLAWLEALREQALERFRAAGLPARGDEDWKYTDVRGLARRLAPPASGPGPVAEDAVRALAFEGLEAHRIVLVDGFLVPGLSALGALPEGVTVMGLAEALAREPQALAPWLRLPEGADGFTALNLAFMTDGVWLRVADGVALERPLQIVHLRSAAPGAGAHLRHVLTLGAGARATVIETYGAAGEGETLDNVGCTVALAAGAALEHYVVRDSGERLHHVGRIDVRQEAGSRYVSHNVTLGGRLTRSAIHVELAGEGAETHLYGAYVVGGRQQVDSHTRIEHRTAGAVSRELYKGVLDGRARGAFTGRVVVHPGAQRTDAEQANHNLLLSEDAEADSRPQLEIYADDVKCSHGSTVGELDETSLFYLRSRGIDAELARSLLVYAFASDVLERMALEPVRVQLERRLTAVLLAGREAEGVI